MPELPEVETVRRGLTPVMTGRTLTRVDVRRPDLRFPFPQDFAARLTGQTIDSLDRRSKYLLLHLASGQTVIIHLGMSGRMTIDPDSRKTIEKHDHVSFYLDDGQAVHFADPRRFGLMDLTETDSIAQHKLFAAMGPEPLGNTWDATHLFAALHKRRSPIKSLLLDQKVVAGLGNIYVCEALYRSQLHPETQGIEITQEDCDRLVPHVRDILTEAIASGGSTLRDYVRSDGGLGYFQHAFAVYDQEGTPCQLASCTGVIARMVQSNRSTFYCPVCQAPRKKKTVA